ncbi:RelE family toxin-antitoxin system [Klebsiella quasipneumoniae]|uniref:ead/Ea22-like family protein n=1 Tax=Klebsiella quasipneumoniae TaxID=1463165 RepID=UPI0009CDC066|nr:ead/Ea22-like family protein [Klebsiella quasipneumoniae]SLX36761.1 RelE family toxin-antitoxin system [Klebsiella quasipneumoniae]SLX43950.1 RelE family toxin-antitoxin system [Klebsiella quasipneumoniae]SLX44131.1 RelE family toxin-antitoxin system [Klebsiella quasipneumoniae]SLX49531.1 RelE family toxin-antitoxin system [Klebsiella quasipneumoniae]SLX59352.1 RelE family toxin-antitoxin system [Klebsiella quasipneumoniae]
MTDITELAQRMKTAAEKLDADQWQTRKGFSGIEVIVKGSLEKGHGCVSFQPVAADMADTKTARAIALFSPANVLALVEALEKAQTKAIEQGRTACELFDEVTALRQRIAELEREQEHLRPVGVMSEQAFHRLENRECRFIALWPRPGIFLPRKRPEDGVIVYARTAAAAGIKVEAE